MIIAGSYPQPASPPGANQEASLLPFLPGSPFYSDPTGVSSTEYQPSTLIVRPGESRSFEVIIMGSSHRIELKQGSTITRSFLDLPSPPIHPSSASSCSGALCARYTIGIQIETIRRFCQYSTALSS